MKHLAYTVGSHAAQEAAAAALWHIAAVNPAKAATLRSTASSWGLMQVHVRVCVCEREKVRESACVCECVYKLHGNMRIKEATLRRRDMKGYEGT